MPYNKEQQTFSVVQFLFLGKMCLPIRSPPPFHKAWRKTSTMFKPSVSSHVYKNKKIKIKKQTPSQGKVNN